MTKPDFPQQTFTRLFGPEFGHGKPFDLAPLRAVLHTLGDPQANLPPVIHVAGTNGKGSTIAFMRAIAEAAGLRVHAFTKPHLFALRERFVLAGAEASDAALIDAAERIARISTELTQFDAQVAAAFLLFDEVPADLVLLETGMGGRDDSTNVVPNPALTVITPIGLDHQDALGVSLTEIAAHKAGILKSHAPAIIARQDDSVSAVIEACAEAIGAPLYRQGVEWDAYASKGRLVVQTETRALDLPLPTLAGAHQIDNAGLACAALLAPWRHAISDEAFAAGVARAVWPARLQPLTRGALSAPVRAVGGEVWVDGGHNAHGAQALARALATMQQRRKAPTIAIVGMRARKDADSFIAALASEVDQLIAIELNERSAGLQTRESVGSNAGLKTRAPLFVEPTLIAAHAQAHGLTASTAPSLTAAMQGAAQLPAPRVLICGSFLLAAEALSAERA